MKSMRFLCSALYKTAISFNYTKRSNIFYAKTMSPTDSSSTDGRETTVFKSQVQP